MEDEHGDGKEGSSRHNAPVASVGMALCDGLF